MLQEEWDPRAWGLAAWQGPRRAGVGAAAGSHPSSAVRAAVGSRRRAAVAVSQGRLMAGRARTEKARCGVAQNRRAMGVAHSGPRVGASEKIGGTRERGVHGDNNRWLKWMRIRVFVGDEMEGREATTAAGTTTAVGRGRGCGGRCGRDGGGGKVWRRHG